MQMPSRKYQSVTLSSAEGYRYGFNGKEKDKDINSLTAYDYGFRIYNPAIGKFLSEDPLTKKYPELTPYQFASNSPIEAIDVDGLESSAYRPLGQLAPSENAYKSGSESVNQKPNIDRKAELKIAPREQPAFRASTNQTSTTPASKPKTWQDDMIEAQDAWDATTGKQLQQEQVDAVENSPTKIFPVIGNLKTAGRYELMGMHKQAVGALKDAGVEVAVGYGVGKMFSLASKVINTAKGGIQYGAKGDIFLRYASKAEQPYGILDVSVHGSSNSVMIGTEVNHRVLASLIKQNPQFTGQPIRLLSCNTGSLPNGFAKNLSNKLGVQVFAPNNIIWAFPNGKLTIGALPTSNNGSFMSFLPGIK